MFCRDQTPSPPVSPQHPPGLGGYRPQAGITDHGAQRFQQRRVAEKTPRPVPDQQFLESIKPAAERGKKTPRTARAAALPSSADLPESTDRAKPRPHWRRAHWHTFWTGPLNGERIAQVKWLPPIAVGLDG